MNTRHPQPNGFSLLEVMVALVVVAIGMLGSAATALDALRASRTALQWTQATALAADLAECIRANRAAGTAYSLSPSSNPPRPAKACTTPGQCSPSEVAELDMYRWQRAITLALPDASAGVTAVPGGSNSEPCHYTIVIRWAQAGEPAPAEYVLQVQS